MLDTLKTNDEEGRARALERLNILDSADEQPFESITSLVESVLSVPMCAISLVDRDRQWFKSEVGMGDKQTPRDISFCTHTIREAEPFIIPDSHADPRFSDSPLVREGPKIRSYIGIPLKTPDGYNIGALCAMDTEPREFGPQEIEVLTLLSKMVLNEIELREIASLDKLSGALTRRAWTERAETEVARSQRHDHSLCLLIFDLDHFKQVNDTYGHSVGDQVIASFSEICRKDLRCTDFFGRYGGEEFVALLPDTEISGAVLLAERCRKIFEAASIELADKTSVKTTVSIGVAQYHRGEELATLIDRADKALYQAKNFGRNRTAGAPGDHIRMASVNE